MPLPPSNPPSSAPPGRGLLGWLGRQIGYVSKAVKTDIAAPQIVYRNGSVEEVPHPDNPAVKLRRTVIDEVLVEPPGPKA